MRHEIKLDVIIMLKFDEYFVPSTNVMYEGYTFLLVIRIKEYSLINMMQIKSCKFWQFKRPSD